MSRFIARPPDEGGALTTISAIWWPGTGMKRVQTIFITDLDGTLLGHDDFAFAAIRADILAFLARGIMIIEFKQDWSGD